MAKTEAERRSNDFLWTLKNHFSDDFSELVRINKYGPLDTKEWSVEDRGQLRAIIRADSFEDLFETLQSFDYVLEDVLHRIYEIIAVRGLSRLEAHILVEMREALNAVGLSGWSDDDS